MTSIPEGYSVPASLGTFQGQPNNCFGCGPGNDNGLRLEIAYRADGVRAVLSFDRRLESYPGIIHGGILATVCDELMGHVVHRETGSLVATSSMNIRYIAPVRTGHRYHGSATRRQGTPAQRTFRVTSEITNDEGEAMVIARAVFTSAPF